MCGTNWTYSVYTEALTCSAWGLIPIIFWATGFCLAFNILSFTSSSAPSNLFSEATPPWNFGLFYSLSPFVVGSNYRFNFWGHLGWFLHFCYNYDAFFPVLFEAIKAMGPILPTLDTCKKKTNKQNKKTNTYLPNTYYIEEIPFCCCW